MSDVYGTIAQGVNPLQMAGQAMQIRTSQQQLLNQQQQLQANQFALQQAKLQPAYAGIMSLDPNTANWGDIQHALAQSERVGGDISGLTTNLNEMMAQGGTPADYIKSTRIRGMPSWEQYSAAGGLTGAELMQPISWTDAQGTHTVPLGQAIRMGYGSGAAGMGMVGGSGGGGSGAGGAGGEAPATTTPPAANKQAFIQSFGPTAQRIAKATGLPVNYVLAQAGLETGWGTSGGYQRNNFFGISPGGAVAGYRTPDEGADAYINLINSRYANVPRTGSLQDIGDAMARAGYNPMVPGAPGGPSYGARIQSFAAGLPEPGSYQVASTGPVAPPTGAAPALGQAPAMGGGVSPFQGGVLTTTPPFGAAETWKNSVGQFNTDRSNAYTLQQRTSQLSQALDQINAHPDLQFGPHMEEAQSLQGFLSGVLGRSISPQDLNNLSAFQEINKELRRYVEAQPGAERSDLAAVNVKMSNPSVEQQREALKDLISRTIGLERMRIAGYMAFSQKYGENAPGAAIHYLDEVTPYMQHLDPVAFAYDRMDPVERRQYYDSLSGTAKTEYENSVLEASRLFQLPLPGGSQ